MQASRGIPLPALFTGVAAVAAMVFLVAFFVAGGDQSTGRSGIANKALDTNALASAEITTQAAPAASFIVISAPDDPVAVEQKKSSPPRLAFSPSVPNASTVPTAAKTSGADAGATPSLVTAPLVTAPLVTAPLVTAVAAPTREIVTPYDTPEVSPAPAATSPPAPGTSAPAPVEAPAGADAGSVNGGGGSVSQDPQPKGGTGEGVTGPASGASGASRASDTPN